MKLIHTKKAPEPAGHYSQAIVHEGLVFVSGMLPINPATGERQIGSVEQQTELLFSNLRAVLDEAGTDLNHVLNIRIYLSDVSHWAKVNQVCAQELGKHKPTRSIVPTSSLHYGFDVELEAIAAVKK
jgi:2-iminobutanoate/2-iminopropanoate deaminase